MSSFASMLNELWSWFEPNPAASQTVIVPTDAVEVIPPRDNTVDALGIELLLSRIAPEKPFSLEFSGDAHQRRLIVRAEHETLLLVQRQIQATYPQADFRPVPEEQDPACEHRLARMSAELTLRRPEYLSLRTFRNGDFREADPVIGLLGAFAALQEGERMLSQLILFPAPLNWADRYQGLERQIEQSSRGGEGARSADLLARQFAGLVASIILLATTLWGVITYLQHKWLEFGMATLASVAAFAAMLYAIKRMTEHSTVNPEMVRRKLEGSSAFDVRLRLTAFAKTPELARVRLRSFVKAYSQFNLSSGNALVGKVAAFDPRDITLPRASVWHEWLGREMRLTVSEIASMWHVPVGHEAPFIEHTRSKRLLPIPSTVASGVLIGHSIHQGQQIPVHLDEESLWRHIFMVAKTQMGKSTAIANLALQAMRRDAALTVIDPHGDLARAVLGVVPPSRASDVIYVDLGDQQQIIGLNLLDATQGRSPELIVDNLVHTGQILWKDFWGPRMEDALRMAAYTLLCANEALAAQGQPQFSLLDVLPLFELRNFRHRLLADFVHDKVTRNWWSDYFESMYEKMQKDVINPVQSKIHRFTNNRTVRGVVCQSKSTINFRELLSERKLLVVNTAAGVIGPDASGLLGAVIVDSVNFALREQMKNPDPTARTKAIVVIDEFQTLSGVDYESLMSELHKMGGSCILATQSLGQLDEIRRQLRRTVLSNVSTLFVFQTSAEDADYLRHELDDAVSTTDVINLDDYASYVKSKMEHKRLPVMHVETLAPQPKNESVLAQIAIQMKRYTRLLSIAESEWNSFQDQWFAREHNLLDASLTTGRNQKSEKKPEESRDDPPGQAAPARPPPPQQGLSPPDQPTRNSTGEQKHAAKPSNMEKRDETPTRVVPAAAAPPSREPLLPNQPPAGSKVVRRDEPNTSSRPPEEAATEAKSQNTAKPPTPPTPNDKETGEKPRAANP